MPTELTYRSLYVMVPRAALQRWSHEPWAVVLAAAERGEDGLTVQHGRPVRWQGLYGERPPDPPNVAFLAEGQHDWIGKTVLHQQN